MIILIFKELYESGSFHANAVEDKELKYCYLG